MSNVTITTVLSDDDRAAIVHDVIAAFRQIMAEAQEPRLVDGDRLAELLEVSRPTVDRNRADGVIPSITIGRRRLYRPDAVIDALERQEGSTNA
ncbi:hypothetical protein Q31b_40610 [Novipirellula aureliae]|uniref:Helix-turn-helix domain-containing protein n=1 Tax=Novipirellula aureliae TaxID=2527966 RepID=A0A5C6DNW4_9BACT|nr:helix-turn-helix domain-containing protein [Novipirellula aureliae]TWU38983.1 hypothetical protein Q31b_40610 [Novipirellula aureliae]